MLRTIVNPWLLAAVGVVALAMGPVLIGLAPQGGDPELMYQPIKSELVRALADGHLPFWSERFGLGVPLAAESHVAAFYPPNWLFYRILDVNTAYRLMLWLHYIAIAAATYAYARILGIGTAGSALAGIAFALCGFQAVHAVHEPFYHLMPFLPICLILADRYAASGKLAWLAGLAIAWGTQVVLGHFQVQMWTAGLVLLAGGWRVTWGHPPGERAHPRRIIGLMLALVWGAAIAFPQLRLTWELTRVSGFQRPPEFLTNYTLPPVHMAQLAMPPVFLGRPRGPDSYWKHLGTTAGEACLYIGVVPLILAILGLIAAPRDRALAPWRLVAPLTLAMATMVGWWPNGFYFLLTLPGINLFRAPARYTLLTSLGLVLLAGRGLDLGRSTSWRRFTIALLLAIGVLAGSCWWSLDVTRGLEYRATMGPSTILWRYAGAGIAWGLGLIAIVAWRLRWIGAWAPFTLSAIELSVLLFVGPVEWDWSVRLPESSPVLTRVMELNRESPGLVANRLMDVPVMAGLTTAFPQLGISPPPPNYLLEPSTRTPLHNTIAERRWHRRFGVAYGIWGGDETVSGTKIVAKLDDPALDRVMSRVPNLRSRGPWRIVRYPGAFPFARVAISIHQAERWGELYTYLSTADRPDEAWFLTSDGVPTLPDPMATSARVESWNGRTAVVAHDGSCVLILRRTHYPGWSYRIDGGPSRPVFKVDGGLQAIPIAGAGTSRVDVSFHPTGLSQALVLSLSALGIAVGMLVVAGVKARHAS